uniref:Amino acid transporter transmembrane domain-containing protein n=1 Tax=Noctiluca scintillans TaxID=2966 RepID=A0A7S1F3M5_NOCSC|mmetsp:Transcript_31019/g.82443  ORF Transcript_31019/g.82443 Transcript_31019/m.82443 type:complete len:448 (+) Transcript_31019:61-1404(+)
MALLDTNGGELGEPWLDHVMYEESFWTTRKGSDADDTSVVSDTRVSSALASSVVLISTSIGTGLLAMPFVFWLLGAVPGALLLCGFATLSAFCSYLLCECCEWSRVYSYEEIVVEAFGQKGACVMESVVIWLLFGAMTSVLVVTGDVLILIADVAAPKWFCQRTALLALFVCIVILPLSSVRSLTALRNSNTVAITCTVIVGILLMSHGADREGLEAIGAWPCDSNVLSMLPAVPIMMLSLGCQVQVPPVYGDLDQRSLPRMTLVLVAVGVACFLIYLSVALFGLAAISGLNNDGSPVPGNALDAFSSRDKSAFAMRAFMGLAMTMVYPLLCVPCRSTVDHLFFGGGGRSKRSTRANVRHTVETLAIVCFTFALATAEQNFAKIFGFTGATAGTLICYVLPLTSYLCIRTRQSDHDRENTRVTAACCIVLLVVLFPLSCVITVKVLC